MPNEVLNILMIDDNPSYCNSFKKAIEWAQVQSGI